MNEMRDVASRKLSDESPEVRRRAVASLERLGLDGAIDLIRRALADDDWRVRKEAVALITRSAPGPAAIASLIDDSVQEEEIGLRNAAAEALGGIGGAAVDAILERLPEPQALRQRFGSKRPRVPC